MPIMMADVIIAQTLMPPVVMVGEDAIEGVALQVSKER